MSETAKSILAAIQSLPDDERAELIDRLIESDAAPDNFAGMTDDEFHAEIRRRCDEAKNGVPGIPWPEVEAEALRELDARSHR
ncbi:MAG TPA: addiction module protein [Gemmataceae bacterium]|jgi:putative addiction module component (TIGR02574 family)|nr:addiction module protein [Gemmataceae bacterium]